MASQARTAAVALRAAISVPVQTSASRGVQLQTCAVAAGDNAGPGHRCYDLPAFWGGDVILGDAGGGNYNECTRGFGVQDTAGKRYMMTAAHCAETAPNTYRNGMSFYNGNFTSFMGQITDVPTDVPGPLDAALIPTDAGNRYYDGPGINSGDTGFTKVVSGQLDPSWHQSLCESGASGGTICSMTVQSTDYSEGPWNSMVLATADSGKYTIPGDRGGPWFSLASRTSVYAIGIHHGITGNIFGPNGATFTPIVKVSTALGVYVNE